MAIKVNARETELKIGKNPGYYYVMTPDLYIALMAPSPPSEAWKNNNWLRPAKGFPIITKNWFQK